MHKTLILVIGALLVAASCGGDSPWGGAGVSGAMASDQGSARGTDGDNNHAGNDNADTDDSGSGSDNGKSDGSGSGGDDGEVVELGRGDVMLTAGLAPFGDCDSLLDYLHAEYSARVGPWGFDRGGWIEPMPLMQIEAVAAADVAMSHEAGAPAATSPLVEGADFSGTNVQEAGVDEADIVKTDGERIVALSSGRLVVVDAPGLGVIGEVAVAEGWEHELFLSGDSVLVVTASAGANAHTPQTVIQRIDIAGGQPRIVETLNVEGGYVSARSVGGTARIILRYDPQHNFPFVYPRYQGGEDTAVQANRAAVLNSTLDDWLPHYSFGAADSSNGPRLTPCPNVHAPSVFSGFGVTTVISVPIDGGFDPSESTAVTAPGDTVYASVGSLYVATTRWLRGDEFDGDEDAWHKAWEQRRTSIHRFDLSGPSAAYAASGEVLGVIRNQFSLSEHAGHLRVVTTVGGPWGSDRSESWVRVLDTGGQQLVEVGSVGDIGRGEQVQSVRFVGDVGYVVTFRQIDPFYTIDLSDPANPAVVGELKIPGFSSYLHPISDTLILGVGSDAADTGRVTGAKVSLFDVSDLAAPQEVAVWTAPDGWHDVGRDHRAFLWWAPENLAVIPVTVGNDWSGAVVLRVADGAIAEVGRVDHVIEGEEPGRTDCRRLTKADLASSDMEDFATELEYTIAIFGNNAVLACEPGEAGITGFECSDEPSLVDEAERLGLLQGDESISVCWPNYQPNVIVRSIVIGDGLWTVGVDGWGRFDRWSRFDGSRPARLHANDLQTLERLAALEL